MASKQQTVTTAAVIGKPVAENLFMQLNESELTAIIMKGSPNSNDRDAGFCSGSSEGGDDLSIDHTRLEPGSPIDASDDSVEVKVTPISLVRNKRKSSEPSKVVCENETLTQVAPSAGVTTKTVFKSTNSSTGPLKKRIRYTSSADSAVVLTPPSVQPTPTPTPTPPQLWDPSQVLPHELIPNPAQIFVRHPGVTTLHRMPLADVEEQQEPLALVAKKRKIDESTETPKSTQPTQSAQAAQSTQSTQKQLNKSGSSETISARSKKITPKKLQRLNEERAKLKSSLQASNSLPTSSATTSIDSTHNEAIDDRLLAPVFGIDGDAEPSVGATSSRPQQRNYKNMTRERRIEANARERTRVHTISAAYETLRRAVPSYSNAQKLSKLSVLRVACSYILTLSRMAGYDYSTDESEPSIASCFDAVTSTILTEGKIRKKKDDEN